MLDEDVGTQRFDDVIVGTRLERNFSIGCLGARCEHDDWNSADTTICPNLTTHLKPIHARHHDVEQDEIDWFPQRDVDSVRACQCFMNVETVAFQHNRRQM